MTATAPATWGELLGVALVGTERKGEPADLALEQAALLGGGRRAGWRPPAVPSNAVDPAPMDITVEASTTAVQILELLLSGAVSVAGGPDPLIADWLDRAARNRVRVPHRLIPAVLERATTNNPLRDAATIVVGARGQWLARQNPQWSWIDVAEDAWEVGTKQQRLAHLRRVRAADQQAAIALIETTWSTEAADVRQQILTTLAEGGLVATDEAFLDAALADRAASVRKVAEAMLHSLPTSSREAERAEQLAARVRIEGLVRKKLLVDDLSTVLERVDTVPLAWWSTHLNAAPIDVVSLARDHGKLVDALIRAVLRQRDAAWADALLRAGAPNVAQAIALVGLVPTASARLVAQLRGMGDKLPAVLNQSAAELATVLDPSVVPELEAWVTALGHDDNARRKVRQLIQALTLRASIAKELP